MTPVDVNRVVASGEAEPTAKRARADADVVVEDARAKASTREEDETTRASTATTTATTATAVPAPARWHSSLPLPPKYEVLDDAFVALAQIGPLLRKRGQASTADNVCENVEATTRRRCTLKTLREVEGVLPGTVGLSTRAPVHDGGALDPRRVRVDVEEGAPGARAPGAGAGASRKIGSGWFDDRRKKFRAALLELVGAHHDAFVAGLDDDDGGGGGGGGGGVEVDADGVVTSWHPKYDPTTAPDPPAARVVGAESAVVGVDPAGAGAGVAEGAALPPAAAATRDTMRSGNGTAFSAGWKRDRSEMDARELEADDLSRVEIDAEAIAARKATLGEGAEAIDDADLATVMKREMMARHENDPATRAERARRRLYDLLPGLFDAVRSWFATRDKKTAPFADIVEQILRTTTKQCASREETERGLRVLANNAEEWCVLWVSEFTGEELWRVKKVDTTKVRFVREKLVALKEDRL